MGDGPRGLQPRTATPGTTSPTTSPAPGPTGGARTASAGSPTTSSVSASPSPSGTSGTRSSRSALFGLTNSEGNHGEDVKEYYFYVDSTPTHSYMKYLYKYPQREFPYRDLLETNRRRTREELEYELLDTGIFDDDRYFDVFLEYAKAGPGRHPDPACRSTTAGKEAARLQLLPTLWFRNTWSWGDEGEKPVLRETGRGDRGLPSRAGRVHALLRRRARSCCSRRTRRTPRSSGASRTRRRTSRTRSTGT